VAGQGGGAEKRGRDGQLRTAMAYGRASRNEGALRTGLVVELFQLYPNFTIICGN